jgi:acetyl-CoA acetyltransferase
MQPVYAVSGGVSKFAKARPDKTFPALVKEAYDYAIHDLGLDFRQFTELVDGSVASYFSDHFSRQLMAGIMVQDYLACVPSRAIVWKAAARRAACASRKRGRPSPVVTWMSAWRMVLRR